MNEANPIEKVTELSLLEKLKSLAITMPEKKAIIGIDRTLSFRELDELSNRIARAILSANPDLPAQTPIGLLCDRKSYAYAIEIGIMKAGLACIPMTDEYPDQRITTCMTDAHSPLLIAPLHILVERTTMRGQPFTCVSLEDLLIADASDCALPGITKDQLAFIVYTSGSTGKPKGVAVEHEALFEHVRGCDGNKTILEIASGGRTLLSVTQISFIAFVFDYIALYHGCTIVMTSKEEQKDFNALSQSILCNQVKSLFATPSLVKNLIASDVGKEALEALEVIMLAGEKLDAVLLERLFQINPVLHIINGYGSTETGGALIAKRMGQNDIGCDVTIGKPVANVKALIMDEDRKEVPVGQRGQLVVVGPRISCGYIGLPEKTREAFFTYHGQRAFCTGDLAILTPNGEIRLFGRADDMVKFHGQRVELGEIESLLLAIDGVKSCKVILKENGTQEFLAAFYESERDMDSKEIIRTLRINLPVYMVPSVYRRLEHMPMNQNKKIDRMKLKEMELTFNDEEYEAPETELEKLLCNEYEAAFGVKRVSVLADFFELGGTSLSVVSLIAELSQLGYPLAYKDVYNNPTPRKLAEFMDSAKNDKTAFTMDRDRYPLTKTQYGIYLEGVTGGSKETYTTQFMMKAAENVSAQALANSVLTLINAHPNMKYIIKADSDGTPYMYPTPEYEPPIPVFDGTEEERIDFVSHFMPVVPVLDSPLFFFAIYRTPSSCYLAFKSHLIFMDGTTVSLIISDLNRALAGQPLVKEEYCIEQVGLYEEHLMKHGYHASAEEYYKNLFRTMSGMDSLTGDRDLPLTPGVSENLRYQAKTLSVQQVKEYCKRLQVTESSFFISAMSILLSKYLHSDQVSFSTVYNGRSLSETTNTIGTLIKRIPVYGDLTKNIPTEDFVKNTAKQIFANMSNDIFSFDEVLKSCPVNEDVEFIYQGDLFTDKMGSDAGQDYLKSDAYFMEQYHTGMVTGCMSIQFFSTNGRYNMTIEYRNERFSPEWVRAFADGLFAVAEGLLTRTVIGEIGMMSDEAKKQIEAFNQTEVNIHFTPVHRQVHEYARTKPDQAAIVSAEKTLTFRELDLLSNQVAQALLERKLQKGAMVAVMLERDPWAYVVENGILKAGGAFLPFVPQYPDERIDYCMKDGDCPFLITTEALKTERTALLSQPYSFLTLEEIFAVGSLGEIRPDARYAAMPEIEVSPEDLAYCIYTSGTTGRPKGVMIEHLNLANYVHKNEKSIEIVHYTQSGRICMAMAAFSFDVSIVEQFIPLCNGNCVYLASEEEIHDPFSFAKAVLDHGITGLTCTPTYLYGMLDIAEIRPALKQLTFFDIGAEAFPAGLYDRLRMLRDDSIILNVYGPTECTMGCAAALIDGTGLVSVGGPIANTSFMIVDSFGNPLPVGITGELIICGDCVGRGYVKQPDKTREAFFLYEGKRAYHSGDLASWTDRGEIRIFGRIDNQIKLRGFRIELDEIENVLTSFTGVKAAAADVRKNDTTEILAAYYTADRPIDPEQLRDYLKSKLTEYMVPSVFIQLDEMPQTANGKLNRKALPQPDFEKLREKYIAPETEPEEKLCAAFERALHLEAGKVGVLDDFFALGGDSLKAMVVLVEAGIDSLTAADIFQKRTPRQIAAAIELKVSDCSLDEQEAHARQTAHRISAQQQMMLDYQFYKPMSTMWSNLHFMARLGQDVDIDRFCAAVNTAVLSHPGLSVAFSFSENAELQQCYMEDFVPHITVEDKTEADIAELQHTLVRPFKKILNAPLYRFRVFRTEQSGYFFFDVHHLLMDGGSFGVLLSDIANAYFDKPIAKDYYFALVEAADKTRGNGIYNADKSYFQGAYGENSATWCTIVDPSHETKSNTLGDRIVRLDVDTACIQKAEEHWGVSHSVMAIASALLALSRFTGKKKVMVSWVFNNRLSPEAQSTVGMLITNLPVGVDLAQFSTVEQLLFEVKRQVGEGIAHSSYDFFAAADSVFLNDPLEIDLQIGFNGSPFDVFHAELMTLDDNNAAAGSRLALDLLENEYKDGGFDSEMEYIEELFDRDYIESFHDLYIHIMESIIKQDANGLL